MKKVFKIIGYVALSFFALLLIVIGFLYFAIKDIDKPKNKPFKKPVEITIHLIDKTSQKAISGASGIFRCRQEQLGFDDAEEDRYPLKEQADGIYTITLQRPCEDYSIKVNHHNYFTAYHVPQSEKILKPIPPLTIEMRACKKPSTIYQISSIWLKAKLKPYTPFIGYTYDLWDRHQDTTKSIQQIAEYGYDLDEFKITTDRNKMDIWLEDHEEFSKNFDKVKEFMLGSSLNLEEKKQYVKLGKNADFIITNEKGQETYLKSLHINDLNLFNEYILMRWRNNNTYSYFNLNLDYTLDTKLRKDILNLLHFKDVPLPTKKEAWKVPIGYAFTMLFQTNGTPKFDSCNKLNFQEYLDKKRLHKK